MYISVWVLFWVWADAEVRRPVGTHQTWGIRQYWFRLTLYAHLLQVMICNSVLGEGVAGQPAPTNVPVGRPVHGMGCIFSSSRNQNFYWFLTYELFLNPGLHTTFPPSYLLTYLSYWLSYRTNLHHVFTYQSTTYPPPPRPYHPSIFSLVQLLPSK